MISEYQNTLIVFLCIKQYYFCSLVGGRTPCFIRFKSKLFKITLKIKYVRIKVKFSPSYMSITNQLHSLILYTFESKEHITINSM